MRRSRHVYAASITQTGRQRHERRPPPHGELGDAKHREDEPGEEQDDRCDRERPRVGLAPIGQPTPPLDERVDDHRDRDSEQDPPIEDVQQRPGDDRPEGEEARPARRQQADGPAAVLVRDRVVVAANAVGCTKAPPAPWTNRAAISAPGVGASAR